MPPTPPPPQVPLQPQKTAPAKAPERDARRRRLEDALRQNLKKRKHQARSRAAAPTPQK